MVTWIQEGLLRGFVPDPIIPSSVHRGLKDEKNGVRLNPSSDHSWTSGLSHRTRSFGCCLLCRRFICCRFNWQRSTNREDHFWYSRKEFGLDSVRFTTNFWYIQLKGNTEMIEKTDCAEKWSSQITVIGGGLHVSIDSGGWVEVTSGYNEPVHESSKNLKPGGKV